MPNTRPQNNFYIYLKLLIIGQILKIKKFYYEENHDFNCTVFACLFITSDSTEILELLVLILASLLESSTLKQAW